MIGVILKAILSGLWKPLLKVLAVFGAYGKGRIDQSARGKLKQHKANDKAHERIDNAEIGIGATDDERRRKLHELGDRLKRG
jgi:hypothetical protein